MTEPNPYDFLSGDDTSSLNGSSHESLNAAQAVAEREPETRSEADDDFSASPYSELVEADETPETSDALTADIASYAPPGAVPRVDSVAALAAQEAHREAHESNGFTAETAFEPQTEEHTNGRADYASSYDHLGQSEAITAYETVPELAPLGDGGTPPPPIDSERAILQPQEPVDPNLRPHDEMDIWAHLGELRIRMLHSIVSVAVAMCITWQLTPQFQRWLLRPVHVDPSIKIIQIDPMGGFTTYFQLSMVSGIMLAAPYVIWQAWLFIMPALTGTEKRLSGFLLPFSIFLFFSGCAVGYLMAPFFFKFFFAFKAPDADSLWEYQQTIILLGKTLVVFGICFQVPVVTIFLNKVGLVSRNWLIEYWRHVVVVIFIVVSILTPTWDPLTLMVCALPPCILYALSIWLIKWL